MKIYMDDVREAPDGWTRTYSAHETIALLEANGRSVTHLSLDHDLGFCVAPGYNVVLYLRERWENSGVEPPAVVLVHSANPVGRQSMEQAIARLREVIADSKTKA